MSRIAVVTNDNDNANPEQAALFEAINSKIGMVLNFLRVLANSPVALEAFPGLHKIASEGVDVHPY